MRIRGPLVAVVSALVAANVAIQVIFPGAGVIVAVCLLAVLAAVAWWAGLSWNELGLGRGTWARGLRWAAWILLAAAGIFVVALLLPWARNLVQGSAPPDPRNPWVRIFVTIPFGTVLVEEFAFRGVLWGLLNRRYGRRTATLGSALLFALWHVLSALGGGAANAALDAADGGGALGTVLRVLGTVLFTGTAGVLFAELRARSGSLLPPMALHWAANALGVAFVAAAVR